MQKYTVVSMGEPAGNSPEMIIRAVRNLAGDPSVWLIVTGDEGVFRKAAADFSLPLPFTYYADDEESLGEAEAGGVGDVADEGRGGEEAEEADG